jgi:protein phosphatase
MIAIRASGRSDPGRTREANEDAFARVTPEDPALCEKKGHLLAVADGLGGHAAGEVASATTLQGLVEAYYAPTSPSRVEPALQRAIQAANLRVHERSRADPRYRAMQSTLSCLVLAGGHGYVGHVGDSRVYHLREGRLAQLTVDHSEAAELVRLRLAKPESLSYHPRRNVLTRTIGGQLFLRPDFQRVAVLTDDVFVLCSDGLWSEVSDEEIRAAALEFPPEEACVRLVELQRSRASQDNVTVVVARVLEVREEEEESRIGGILSRFGWGGRQPSRGRGG